MALEQASTLYAGSVSKAAIYEIQQGQGLMWGPHLRTEINVDGKPRQLTRGIHAGNPLQPNIKNPRDSDFGNTATVTIDGRQLSVVPLITLDKVDLLEWKETFPEYQPTGNNTNLALNPAVASTYFNLIMNAVKTQLNKLHSVGDVASADTTLSLYDGFVKKILADADATQVGTPAVLTVANILDNVYALRNSVEPRLRNNPNLKIFCSYADYDLYDVARRQSQTQLAETDLEGSGSLPQSIGARINLIPMEGIPKNFMFITVADTSAQGNLVQGVWVQNDLETLKVYRTEEADQEIKVVFRVDIGVEYVTGKDIWYLNNV